MKLIAIRTWMEKNNKDSRKEPDLVQTSDPKQPDTLNLIVIKLEGKGMKPIGDVISYEKAFSLPESFLFSLAKFAGLPLAAEQQTRLLNLIQPNHLGYSLRARNDSFGKFALN